MILEMLKKVSALFSVEFMANISNVLQIIKNGMAEEQTNEDDLAYIIRKASSSKKGDQNGEKLEVASIYALMVWYKYFRVGKFYVSRLFEEDIEKISLSEELENKIKKILEDGLRSDSKNVRYWSEHAFEGYEP